MLIPLTCVSTCEFKVELQRALLVMEALLGGSVTQPFAGSTVESVSQVAAEVLVDVGNARSLGQVLPH